MALTTMIPEIWSARLLDYLDKNFVYGNVKWGVILIILAAAATFALFKSFGKIGVESSD